MLQTYPWNKHIAGTNKKTCWAHTYAQQLGKGEGDRCTYKLLATNVNKVSNPAQPSKPNPPRQPTQRTLHGDTITNHFGWLRDPQRTDRTVIQYLKQENDYARIQLAPVQQLASKLETEIAAQEWSAALATASFEQPQASSAASQGHEEDYYGAYKVFKVASSTKPSLSAYQRVHLGSGPASVVLDEAHRQLQPGPYKLHTFQPNRDFSAFAFTECHYQLDLGVQPNSYRLCVAACTGAGDADAQAGTPDSSIRVIAEQVSGPVYWTPDGGAIMYTRTVPGNACALFVHRVGIHSSGQAADANTDDGGSCGSMCGGEQHVFTDAGQTELRFRRCQPDGLVVLESWGFGSMPCEVRYLRAQDTAAPAAGQQDRSCSTPNHHQRQTQHRSNISRGTDQADEQDGYSASTSSSSYNYSESSPAVISIPGTQAAWVSMLPRRHGNVYRLLPGGRDAYIVHRQGLDAPNGELLLFMPSMHAAGMELPVRAIMCRMHLMAYGHHACLHHHDSFPALCCAGRAAARMCHNK